jgi:hypothetical protein
MRGAQREQQPLFKQLRLLRPFKNLQKTSNYILRKVFDRDWKSVRPLIPFSECEFVSFIQRAFRRAGALGRRRSRHPAALRRRPLTCGLPRRRASPRRRRLSLSFQTPSIHLRRLHRAAHRRAKISPSSAPLRFLHAACKTPPFPRTFAKTLPKAPFGKPAKMQKSPILVRLVR